MCQYMISLYFSCLRCDELSGSVGFFSDQIWKTFGQYFFKYFFCPVPSLLSSWDCSCSFVCPLDAISQINESLFIVFQPVHPLCFSLDDFYWTTFQSTDSVFFFIQSTMIFSNKYFLDSIFQFPRISFWFFFFFIVFVVLKCPVSSHINTSFLVDCLSYLS